MAIWFLTTALLGAVAWLAYEAAPVTAAALWLGWVAVLAVTPALARRLRPAQGALFVIFVLFFGWLLSLLFPERSETGTLATGLVVGAAAGLGVHFRRRSLAVSAATIAGVWVAVQTLLLAVSPAPPQWILYSIAALLLGALLGLVFRVLDPELDQAATSDDPDELLRWARAAMDRFDVALARRLLDRAALLSPHHLEVRRAQYAAWKFNPGSDQFHAVAAALMEQADDPLMARYYQDYLAVTQVRPHLPVALHLQLARRLARFGDPDEAARIANLHLQRDPETPGLPAALIATVEAYLDVGKANKALRYANTVATGYPDTEQARRAEAMLKELADDSAEGGG